MIILGLNAYHGDSSACLLRDGALIAAAEEERFRRLKHWAGFPEQSIRYCLEEAGVSLSQVDRVAINQDRHAHLWRKVAYTLGHRPDPAMILARLRKKAERAQAELELRRRFNGEDFQGHVDHVEHHLAHLASAFLASPFAEAVAASVDGFGDFASAGWGLGTGERLAVEGRVFFPHSLGIFYEAITRHLGFPSYGDEYKVMGLAPYGKPTLLGEMRRLVRLLDDGAFELNLDYFRHHREKVQYEWNDCEPKMGDVASEALRTLLGPKRDPTEEITQHHRDVAHSAQTMYEEAFFHLLNHLHARYGVDALALAGGCAMNSVANGKVYARTPFRKLYVQSAAGDAGGAIGAALISWSRTRAESRLGGTSRFRMDHAYWGPQFDDAACQTALGERAAELIKASCLQEHYESEDDLCRKVAALIASGRVVGWFQGRMEWGPRALGNRSILCDPRRGDMKELLNAKIKRRESFRPFAPSILREAVADWFEVDDDVPFMTHVYPIRPEKRGAIPAVTHVDGSGRLQTVTRESNPRYYRLIEDFRDLTGVPLVLNTSFNESEPIVCTPAQALDCFVRTNMDCLVLGDRVVMRPAG